MNTERKERPMLMSAPMVRAILAGTKTQTRRVVKPAPQFEKGYWCSKGYVWTNKSPASIAGNATPYGQPGDRLWVRETFSTGNGVVYANRVCYRATDDWLPPGAKWSPSIHMFRKHSRITLEITAVRVERLHQISAKDILAEGAVLRAHDDQFGHNPVSAFDGNVYLDLRSLWAAGWESINGKGSWALNPWVWVVSFKVLK